MNINLRQTLLGCWRANFFSPRGFILRAAIIGGVFLIAYLVGMREYTSVLNGTVGSVSAGWKASAVLGVAYLAIYMASIVLVPILILAAVILSVWQGWAKRNQRRYV